MTFPAVRASVRTKFAERAVKVVKYRRMTAITQEFGKSAVDDGVRGRVRNEDAPRIRCRETARCAKNIAKYVENSINSG